MWAGALRRSRLGQADGASGFLWPSALVDTSSMSASASACRSRHPSSLLYTQHTDHLMGTRQGPMHTEARLLTPWATQIQANAESEGLRLSAPSAEACETACKSAARTQVK